MSKPGSELLVGNFVTLKTGTSRFVWTIYDRKGETLSINHVNERHEMVQLIMHQSLLVRVLHKKGRSKS